MNPKQIAIADYSYLLPDDKIAMYPLRERGMSKLLIYKGGMITEDIYKNISLHLQHYKYSEHSYLIYCSRNEWIIYQNV